MPPVQPFPAWSWRREAAPLAVLAAQVALAAASWIRAPDRLPVHFDLAGRPHRYGGKVEAILLVPLVAVGLYALLTFLPRRDPSRANYATGAYTALRVAILIFMLGVQAMLAAPAWSVRLAPTATVFLLTGGLFVSLGLALPRLGRNQLAGVRTTATLSDPERWRRTHRVAGVAFGVAGLGLLVAAALPAAQGGLVAAVAIVGAVVATLLAAALRGR